MPEPLEKPAAPLPSATVVLLRDAAGAPEVLLVRRRAGPAFGASYVFPGGLIDAADREAERYAGEHGEVARRCLGLYEGALDYYSAAIRELYEETGVLLARASSGRWAGGSDAEHFRRERRRLNDRAKGWTQLLHDNRLSLACDSLRYFAFWITPRCRRHRYSTRFFAAMLPEGQRAEHDGGEITDSRWLTARAALAAHRAREIVLPPPTRATLKDLLPHRSASGVMSWAGLRERSGVVALLPAIVADGGGERIVLPDDPDYPADHRGALA